MKPASITHAAFILAGAVVAVLCFFNPLYDSAAIAPGSVRVGKLQIQDDERIVDVRGSWAFFRGQFVSSSVSALPDGFAPFPGSWNEAGVAQSRGYASYSFRAFGLTPRTAYTLRIGQTFSACSVCVNGTVIASSGIPGRSAWEESPGWSPVLARFYPAADGSADIVVRVSNYHAATGGTNTPIYLGKSSAVNRLDERRRVSEAFAFSILTVAGLLFFALFCFSTGTRYFLWFSLALVAAGIRSLCFDCLILVDAFPSIPWSAQYRMANLTFPLLVIFSTAFLSEFYSKAVTARRFWVMTSPFIALAAAIVFLPERVSSLILFPSELFALVTIPVVFVFLLTTGIRKLPGGRVVCGAYFAAMAFFVHDLLVSLWVFPGFRLGYFGEMIFLFSVAVVEMDAYAASFGTVKALTARLQDINRSLSRFVPPEIVDLIENGTPSDIDLAIMHVSILSVADGDDRIEPSALFGLLNECFNLVSPIIRAEGGIVARHTAAGSVVLFPRGSEAALRCAVKMQSAVTGRNRAKPGIARLVVGIGIDADSVSPGAVFAGAVVRSGLFERSFRQFRSKILLGASAYADLPDPLAWFIRPVDRPDVDGIPEILFEVFNNDPDVVRDLKYRTQGDVERMLYSAFAGRTDEARSFFEKARAVFPDDPVLQHFSPMVQ